MEIYYKIQKRRITDNYDPYYDLSTVCTIFNGQKIRQFFSDIIRWDCSIPRILSITDIKALTENISDEIQRYDFVHVKNITFEDYLLIVTFDCLSAILLDYLDDTQAGIKYEYSIGRWIIEGD